ncbi:DnaD domain-containing protein [Paraliobacillus ryukyuensis]|uniref:DnaD domain-containing protein n=1 Tax=Paraliobacillus ryukyuensis TaxID=200904 RepID=UPI0009A60B30|nr:DnaD domain protein [Paraliobacillus ryukyuensis]
MKGAFQISREIFKSDVWSDVVKFRIFFYILGNAVFNKDGIDHAGMKIERGQYLRSLRQLQDDLSYREGRGNSVKKYPLTTIQRKIKSLEKDQRITTKSTEYGTLFTVVNYALYQDLDNYKNGSVEQRRNSDGTATEQQWNNNKNVKECIKNEEELFSSNSDDGFSEVIQFYESNLQTGLNIGSVNQQLLIQWYDELGKDLLLAAMKVAAKREIKGTSFVEGVLNKWKDAGVETIEQARLFETQFKQNKKSNVININRGEHDGQPSQNDGKENGKLGLGSLIQR